MNADLCFGFSTAKWKDLSQNLDGDENAWAKAIGVFERRMRERFFSSIDALFAADTKPDSRSGHSAHAQDCVPGFSIMALCCLLIDTLQEFRGKPPSADVSATQCTFPSGPCIKPPPGTRQQFIKFLGRPAFGGVLDDKRIATRFVDGIRSGIFHEAETRKWLIRRNQPAGQIAAKQDDGYVLNRSLFYAALKKEFESYLQELRDPTNHELRRMFKGKMDGLCERA